jgi:hypothetical protein
VPLQGIFFKRTSARPCWPHASSTFQRQIQEARSARPPHEEHSIALTVPVSLADSLRSNQPSRSPPRRARPRDPSAPCALITGQFVRLIARARASRPPSRSNSTPACGNPPGGKSRVRQRRRKLDAWDVGLSSVKRASAGPLVLLDPSQPSQMLGVSRRQRCRYRIRGEDSQYPRLGAGQQ